MSVIDGLRPSFEDFGDNAQPNTSSIIRPPTKSSLRTQGFSDDVDCQCADRTETPTNCQSGSRVHRHPLVQDDPCTYCEKYPKIKRSIISCCDASLCRSGKQECACDCHGDDVLESEPQDTQTIVVGPTEQIGSSRSRIPELPSSVQAPEGNILPSQVPEQHSSKAAVSKTISTSRIRELSKAELNITEEPGGRKRLSDDTLKRRPSDKSLAQLLLTLSLKGVYLNPEAKSETPGSSGIAETDSSRAGLCVKGFSKEKRQFSLPERVSRARSRVANSRRREGLRECRSVDCDRRKELEKLGQPEVLRNTDIEPGSGNHSNTNGARTRKFSEGTQGSEKFAFQKNSQLSGKRSCSTDLGVPHDKKSTVEFHLNLSEDALAEITSSLQSGQKSFHRKGRWISVEEDDPSGKTGAAKTERRLRMKDQGSVNVFFTRSKGFKQGEIIVKALEGTDFPSQELEQSTERKNRNHSSTIANFQ